MSLFIEAVSRILNRNQEEIESVEETLTPVQQLALWAFDQSTKVNTPELLLVTRHLIDRNGVNAEFLPADALETIADFENRGLIETFEGAEKNTVIYGKITTRGKAAIKQVRKQQGVPYQAVKVRIPVKTSVVA